ncbi:TPM domain-containing protein [Anaerotalea alkaliphila]|uniref:TPM domain-containing protein n=1 Tax=Anaerotalea alkaliphila TaxID=2662126 RepID=A0A7X5HX70_9FIRM|nr:TPM domain-containing protein [Anaerotalea alkaliphila]NDL68315.1 TPM domain-containing protein [Anaerotalea alkaliphila]
MKKTQLAALGLVLHLVLGLFLQPVLAAGVPAPTREFYVNDAAGVLGEETEQLVMEANLWLEGKTGAQIVVLTIPSLEGAVLETYSLDVLRTWGIGAADKNNGVLILLSVEDRRSRIEVGYGLEGALPDGKTGRIQDEAMLPYFRLEDYDAGIRSGFQQVLYETAMEYGLEVPEDFPGWAGFEPMERSADTGFGLSDILFWGAILLFFLFDWTVLHGTITQLLLLLLFRGGGGRGGGGFGGGFGGGGGRGGGGGSSRGW